MTPGAMTCRGRGAGPAGSATAILLAERGLVRHPARQGAFPRPKICGEYLSPEAARVLDRLGVLKDGGRGRRAAAPRHAHRGARRHACSTARIRPAAAWRGYRDHALAIRREVFDRILLERARALPVDVRERHRVTGLIVEGGRVGACKAENAEGAPVELRSAARWWAPTGGPPWWRTRSGSCGRTGYGGWRSSSTSSGIEGLDDRGEIYVDPPDYSILNPVAPGIVNVSLVVPLAHAKPYRGAARGLLRGADEAAPPRCAARLAGMQRRGAGSMAMGPLAYRVAEPRVGGVLLAGDAAGFYDPFTGEGLYTALRSAELLAEVAHPALTAGDVSAAALAPYARAARRRASATRRESRSALQLIIAPPPPRQRRRALLQRRPAPARTLMGVIGDFIPPREISAPRFSRPLADADIS